MSRSGTGICSVVGARDAPRLQAQAEPLVGPPGEPAASRPPGLVEEAPPSRSCASRYVASASRARAGWGRQAGELDALRAHARAVHVEELLEVEVHEVLVALEEVRRAEREPRGAEVLLDPRLAAPRALGPQVGVAAEGAGAREREEAGQLRGPARRRAQAGRPPAGRTTTPACGLSWAESVGRDVCSQGGLERTEPRLARGLVPDAGEGPAAPARSRGSRPGTSPPRKGGSWRTLAFSPHSPSPEAPASTLGPGRPAERHLPREAEPRERHLLARGRDQRGHRRAGAVALAAREPDGQLVPPPGRVRPSQAAPRGRGPRCVGVPQLARAVDGAARGVGVVVGLAVGEAPGEAQVASSPRARGRARPQASSWRKRSSAMRCRSWSHERPPASPPRSPRRPRPGRSRAEVGVAGLGAEARAHRARPASGREELDDPGQAARPVERGEGAAHDLRPLHEGGGQLLEVHRAALQVRRVVEREPVEEDEGVVRVAAADVGVRLPRAAAAAEQLEAGHVLEDLGGAPSLRGPGLLRPHDRDGAGGRGHRPRGDGGRLVEDRGLRVRVPGLRTGFRGRWVGLGPGRRRPPQEERERRRKTPRRIPPS